MAYVIAYLTLFIGRSRSSLVSNHSRLKLSSKAIRQVELTAPKEVLLERIERDYRKGRHLPTKEEREAAKRYYDARVCFINSVYLE